jgi:chemotaxis protein MotA
MASADLKRHGKGRPVQGTGRRAWLPGLPARLDPAGAVGLVAAFSVIGLAIATGAAPSRFVDLPSVLIVLGGTFAVTLASFTLQDFARLPQVMGAALSATPPPRPRDVADDALELAGAVRQASVALLEQRAASLARHGFLHRGLMMLLEGAAPQAIERVLIREIEAMAERQHAAVAILRRAAEVAPAMGLIGTLIGLVQMLGHLEDPEQIGPAMAVALLTTLYGALLAHALFGPLAERLAARFSVERLAAELQLVAAVAIAERDNPRRLEAALNGLLAPEDRAERFD